MILRIHLIMGVFVLCLSLLFAIALIRGLAGA